MIVSHDVINRKGQRVQGLYFGMPFVGRVEESRFAGSVMKHSIVLENIESSDRIPKEAGETIIVAENPVEPFLIEVC